MRHIQPSRIDLKGGSRLVLISLHCYFTLAPMTANRITGTAKYQQVLDRLAFGIVHLGLAPSLGPELG